MKAEAKRNIAVYIILSCGLLIMMYPLIFALLGSIVSARDFSKATLLPFPHKDFITFANFGIVFKSDYLLRPLMLTAVRTVWYAVFSFVTSVAGGYVFAFMRFKYSKAAFFTLLSSMMIPGIALMMPQYIFYAKFPLVGGNDIFGKGGSGFINTAPVLFIGGLFSAYNIYLLRQSFHTIGTEFKEAAQIDGAGNFKTMFMVYVPMVKPLLAVIFLGVFIGQWNDYMFPMIYVNANSKLYPIGLAAVRLQSNYVGTDHSGVGLMDYPVVYAISIVMMLPPVLAYVLTQRQFIEGLTMGAVKG